MRAACIGCACNVAIAFAILGATVGMAAMDGMGSVAAGGVSHEFGTAARQWGEQQGQAEESEEGGEQLAQHRGDQSRHQEDKPRQTKFPVLRS